MNGLLFAFLSLCLYTEFYHSEDTQYEGSIARVFQKVEALKKKNSRQIAILSVHWGMSLRPIHQARRLNWHICLLIMVLILFWDIIRMYIRG